MGRLLSSSGGFRENLEGGQLQFSVGLLPHTDTMPRKRCPRPGESNHRRWRFYQ